MIEVVECGCCGHYHLAPLTNLDDCRYDANRFNWEQLDEKFGKDGWIDVTEDEDEDEDDEDHL